MTRRAETSRGGRAHLQNQNYLITESINVYFKTKGMAIKVTIITTIIMMKIMIK